VPGTRIRAVSDPVPSSRAVAAWSVCDLIERAAASHGDAVILSEIDSDSTAGASGGREVTYRQLVDTSRRLGRALRELGLRPGDRVAVLIENRIELVVTEWACLLMGLVWVACNVRTSPEELQVLIDDCEPRVLLHSRRMREVFATLRPAPDCVRIEADPADPAWLRLTENGGDDADCGTAAPAANDPVRIRYTSGTAGKPKGAVLARRAYDASVEAVAAAIGPLASTDVLLQVAPMTHASGAMLLPHAAVGAKAVILDGFDAARVIDVIEKARITAIFVVPTMLFRLLDAIDEPRRVESLKTIVYGGASMPLDRLEQGLALLGPRFVQIYGLTESTWPVCALSRDDHTRRPDESIDVWRARLRSCGRPTAVGELCIVDLSGGVVATGEVGEICVRGRNTMKSYWTPRGRVRDRDTKGLDQAGWMHTGDIGFMDDEGYVTIVDRLHDMIITGGFNVYPREVEDVISRHPAVLEAAVVGRPDPEWGAVVHAAVVLRAGKHLDARELVEHCSKFLAGYKKPRSVEIVDALPKNASGKVLRRAVRDRGKP
jgi:acyl-CoA synthetase (AMP-forming)/AMP-acid ligase II